ncbi:MAG: ABC transporter permease [Clostridiales bacterium]|nr:ABC transporter permease [Clostridiales bacterium]
MLAVFRKEMKTYFSSITGYIFMGFFLLLSGFFVTLSNLLRGNPDYNGVLSSINFVFLFVVPILTMRLMSEEKKQQTDQLLLTSPLNIWDIVLGKYLAAVGVFLMTLLITCIYPIMMSFFGELAWAEIIGGYVGFFLLGCAFISVGLFASSKTDNQVISAVVTFSILLFIWLLDGIQQGIPVGIVYGVVFAGIIVAALAMLTFSATKNKIVGVITGLVGLAIMAIVYFLKPQIYAALIGNVFSWFSLLNRYQGFAMGVLSLSPIIYYITFSLAFLFLTVQGIDKKRWV